MYLFILFCLAVTFMRCAVAAFIQLFWFIKCTPNIRQIFKPKHLTGYGVCAIVNRSTWLNFFVFLFSFLKTNPTDRLSNRNSFWECQVLKTKKLFKIRYGICFETPIPNHLLSFELKQETCSGDSSASFTRTKILMHSQCLYSFYQSIFQFLFL